MAKDFIEIISLSFLHLYVKLLNLFGITYMDKYLLRAQYMQHLNARDLDSLIDTLEIYLNYFFEIIINHHEKPLKSKALVEAQMVHQMMFTKTLSIKKLAEGISFKKNRNQFLNEIVDPTTILSLIRNLYETAFTFSLIFKKNSAKDEHQISYLLWVIAGLKYRQKFSAFTELEESKLKLKQEAETIENLSNEITDSEKYLSLSEEEQKTIKNSIKRKDFKVLFTNEGLKQLSWGDSRVFFDLNNDLMDETYTYFSLYAHPSNVSVFQFSDMFNKESEDFKGIVATNLRNTFSLLSFFIADYIHLFPDTLNTFNRLPKINQIIIDHYNTWMRPDEMTINDAFKYLELE